MGQSHGYQQGLGCRVCPTARQGVDGDKFLDGQVVMSIGDPDKAKHVSVSVPGTGATVTDGLEGGIKRIDAMQFVAGKLTPTS
ncbi:alpha/beta hydrolase [Embleya sp. NPDC050493]|uniref:alpha/beta hydrolase n=1 Tax=Embleya sp. NPDC050493 TaxID=3363989 RepID=UPI00379DBDBE